MNDSPIGLGWPNISGASVETDREEAGVRGTPNCPKFAFNSSR